MFILFITAFLKITRGQSLCRKSTSGWTVASVFYGAGRQSKATKIRAATVQSSVWTLQQILPDELYRYSKSSERQSLCKKPYD